MTLPRRRWWTKKLARGAVAALSLPITEVQKRVAPSVGVRVLTYHRFGSITRDPFCVTPESFDEQMAWLASEGRAVSLDDVIAFAEGKRELRDGAVLVTMDDGYESMLKVAQPILAKHGVPCVAFVTAGLLNEPKAPDWPERFMSDDELRALARGGVEIGAHGFTHRSMGRLEAAELEREVVDAKARLESVLGTHVRSWAYPFGTHGDFTDETDSALERAGYEVAFHSQHGPVRARSALVSLPRIKIEAGKPFWQFRAMCDGAMDAWSLVDRNLWRLQRVRRELVGSRG